MLSLVLHPRLTVVSGVDEGARAGLVGELIGGLGPDRNGVHLEVTDDAGRDLAIFRPAGGAHRVIDVGSRRNLTGEFRDDQGRVDLLAPYGLSVAAATTAMYVDRERIDSETHRDEVVNRLAELDQSELWSAASRYRLTAEELRTLGDDSSFSERDAEVVARIEARHQELEATVEHQTRLRRLTGMVAALALASAVPILLVRPIMAVPVLAVGLLTILFALTFRGRIERARREEDEALSDAGAESYLGYMVQRVDGLLSGTDTRKRMVALAEDHRNAAVHWTRIAGDTNVDWALDQHDRIEAASSLRRQLKSLTQVSSTAPELDELSADLAQAVHTHLRTLRHLGATGESFPLILDDPFTAVPSSTRLALLEVLARAAGTPQVILLTEIEDVASWARLESLTGEVALVEPVTSASADHGSTELAG